MNHGTIYDKQDTAAAMFHCLHRKSFYITLSFMIADEIADRG